MWTGLGLGPSLSKAKDRTGPDLQTLHGKVEEGSSRDSPALVIRIPAAHSTVAPTTLFHTPPSSAPALTATMSHSAVVVVAGMLEVCRCHRICCW